MSYAAGCEAQTRMAGVILSFALPQAELQKSAAVTTSFQCQNWFFARRGRPKAAGGTARPELDEFVMLACFLAASAKALNQNTRNYCDRC
jgi:hypothetical protein